MFMRFGNVIISRDSLVAIQIKPQQEVLFYVFQSEEEKALELRVGADDPSFGECVEAVNAAFDEQSDEEDDYDDED